MLSFVVFMSTVAAAEVTTAEMRVPVKAGYQTINMNEFSAMSANRKSDTRFSGSVSCITRSGLVIGSDDARFQTCLSETQTDPSRRNDESSAQSGGNTNFQINFGEN